MEHYEIEVCGVRRQLPYIPIKKDLAFASFVIISDTELISACGKELADRIGPVDALVTAEAKGIALAYEVSRQMGLKEFIVIRKSVKAYMKDVVETTVNSITTTEMQRLYLDGVEADKIRGKNICLLDDVISTGGSLLAMEHLVELAGGTVVDRIAVLAEGAAAQRQDIKFLAPLPVFNADGTIK